MSTPLIEANDISVTLNGNTVLKNINLSINRNEIVTLIGPNGAGKTTLVRTILGLIPPTRGKIICTKKLKIGYMPQKLKVDTTMPITVGKFLSLIGCTQSKVQTVLDEVGITPLARSPLQSISGGELQRVLLARALLRDPDLLVLDEPVQGVDINGQAELYDLISLIKERHQCGILMVSHDLHVVMAKTDTVVCLNQHICCHGHPESVSAHPAYLELFGDKSDQTIAIYTHHHDHEHDVHGNVTPAGDKP